MVWISPHIITRTRPARYTSDAGTVNRNGAEDMKPSFVEPDVAVSVPGAIISFFGTAGAQKKSNMLALLGLVHIVPQKTKTT